MKKIKQQTIKIIVVIFLLSVYSCQIEKEKVITYNGITFSLNSFSSKENGIYIEYPSSWELIDAKGDMLFGAKLNNDAENMNISNTIHVTKIAETDQSKINLTEIVDESLINMEESFLEFNLLERSNLIIDEYKSEKLKCVFLVNGNSVISTMYFVNSPNKVHLIGCTSLANQFESLEKVYDYIAKSFSIQ
ncbi:MAG: hypothetical protein H0V01_07800 [Bacteroidetes bacterium]|nr:hypothetical protein [Bacteroidota bacterium]